MEQHEAFLRQARSDFQVFEILREQDRSEVPECHPLHYLQMATEKLAKAAFMALGVDVGDRYSHVAFSHIPHHLCRRDVARALGWADFRAFQAFLRGAAPLFREIDELNPSVGPQQPGGAPQEGPNVEYPWRARDAAGEITWFAPTEHRFGLLDRLRHSSDGARQLQFVRLLLERFEGVFR
jgi:hypothetical protein